MQKIVAIGGGDIRQGTTFAIDQEIIQLTGQESPHALFIPTALEDDPSYVDSFEKVYGGELGCNIDVLYLIKEEPPREAIQEKIEGADLIYVGGGNTLRMMNVWRKYDLDGLLQEAMEAGTVMAGISAGAISWFEFGHSDAKRYTSPDNWKYIKARGLGWINAIMCPHVNEPDRMEEFKGFMKKFRIMGLGIEENAALEFVGNTYRVLQSQDGAKVHRVFREGRQLNVEPVVQTPAFLNIERLLRIP